MVSEGIVVETVGPSNQRKERLFKEVSVMAWIENQFGDVLLLKQKRGNRLWTLPGGKVRRRESLREALKREVFEETGLKIHSPVICHLFERPEKDVLTFLFRAKLKGVSDVVHPKASEIETARYGASLPRDATPSLVFFWKHLHATVRDEGYPLASK